MWEDKRHSSAVEIINNDSEVAYANCHNSKKKKKKGEQLKIYVSNFKLKFMGREHLKGYVHVILLIPKTGGEWPLSLTTMAKLIKAGN